MVYRLTALVGHGEHIKYGDNQVEKKEFVELMMSKTEIPRKRAEVKILELKRKYPNIIKVFIQQTGKVKLSNGCRRRIIATWEGGKWT